MSTAQPEPPRLDTHPAYRDTVGCYRLALMAWQGIWFPCSQIGMSEREYCDRYVQFNFHPFTWAAIDTAGQDWTQAHADAAFEEAQP